MKAVECINMYAVFEEILASTMRPERQYIAEMEFLGKDKWKVKRITEREAQDQKHDPESPEDSPMTTEHQRLSASSKVANAIIKGLLVKPERCSTCLKRVEPRKLHAHHRNYSKALEVEWLCSVCHTKRHKLLRWFAVSAQFLKWCAANKVNPEDRHLPAHHKKTGAPLKLSILQHWLQGGGK